ncbi:MAG: DUF3368 domain-containing protein [Microscillaceae bacterium]|nr:DUF3368 domain-containing protein [Microscillaceae bacterium]
MIIISDTTTITNLWKIVRLDILRQLYGVVIIPKAVWDELTAIPQQAIDLVQQNWIQVQLPNNQAFFYQLLQELDEGESEAIALSVELNADYLIIDETLGRKKARSLQIKVIGLLGILLLAKQQNLISELKSILEELENRAGFFIHPALYKEVLELARES